MRSTPLLKLTLCTVTALTLDRAIQYALTGNPEIAAIQWDIAAAEAKIDMVNSADQRGERRKQVSDLLAVQKTARVALFRNGQSVDKVVQHYKDGHKKSEEKDTK